MIYFLIWLIIEQIVSEFTAGNFKNISKENKFLFYKNDIIFS
jgi:hypothetical protein